MIITVTLNAAVDRTYMVKGFNVGRMHVPDSLRVVPGGKGVNVARVLKTLGKEIVTTGFAGGTGSVLIEGGLRAVGILPDFVRVAEEARRVIAIIDSTSGNQTRLDEEGPVILPSEVQKLLDKVDKLLAKKAEMLIMSGSAPRGVPFTIYADLIALAKQRGVPAILDTRDETLAEGVKANPEVIKPNLAELQTLVDDPSLTPEAGVAEAVQQIASDGIELVCVSLGKAGAVAATRKKQTWRATPPDIKYVSSVGSGDAMVAGLAVGLLAKRPVEDILRLGVGSGTADAATFGAGFAKREQILQCAQGVKVERVA